MSVCFVRSRKVASKPFFIICADTIIIIIIQICNIFVRHFCPLPTFTCICCSAVCTFGFGPSFELHVLRESLQQRSCNVMQARRRMLNQGWSKPLDAVQFCMSSPDCSFFSYLANSNSPAIHWSLSLSLQLAANSLSLPPRTGAWARGGRGCCLFAGEFVRNARWCGIRGGQGLMSLARGCEGSSAWVTCRVGRLCRDSCSCAV